MTYPGRAEARVELRRLLEAARALVKRRQSSSDPGEVEKREAEQRLAALLGRYFDRLAKKAAARLTKRPPARQKVSYVEDEFDADFFDDGDFLAALAALLLAARNRGALLLADVLGLELDLTAVNKEAVAAAREYAYDLVKDLTATARETLQTVISEFAATPGMTLGDVIDRLPFSEQRAALIATTEITRAYATGQAAAGAALAEQYPDVRVVKEWFTNVDDRVCPVCGPLHGEEVDEGELFGGEFDGPPAHPGCRCWTAYRTRING